MTARYVGVVFFANDEERIGWRIVQLRDSRDRDLECFFARLHVDKMEPEFVNDSGLLAFSRGELGDSRSRVAGQGCIVNKLSL